MTIANEVYLTLSAASYAASRANELGLPSGWAQVGDPIVGANGFRAGVYRKSDDVVISYTGTDEALVSDFYNANIPGYRGTYSEQFVQAMQLYEATRRANPTANITFTGHSLGGGLAAVMGVYFNRTAVTFDAAPFQASATTFDLVRRYATELAGLIPVGQSMDPQLTAYVANAEAMLAQFATREPNVTQINLQGEVLSVGRNDGNSIYGSGQSISIPSGTQTVTGIALHSIRLLSAIYRSTPFAQAVAQSPQVLEWLTSGPYGRSATSGDKDLITALINAQSSQQAPSLDMLGNDLKRIFNLSTSGVLNTAQLPIAQKAAYWFYMGNSAPSAEFTNAVTGGLSFNIGSSFANNVGKSDFLQEVSRRAGSGYSFNVQTAQRVTFASGAMTVNLAGDIRDIVFGSNQNDSLNGGAGDDLLLGGRGLDTYVVGIGTDVIRDDQAGEGIIRTESGTELKGGKAYAQPQRNKWIGAAGEKYSFVPTQMADKGRLTISEIGTGGTVIVENFDLIAAQSSTGYLGIKLDPTQKIALIQGNGQSVGAATANVYADVNFDTAQLQGKSSSFGEGSGKSFTVNLAQAAKAGETLVLNAMAGLKAILGDETVDANGAVITLKEGQTQVSFALASDSPISEDQSGSISVSYQGGSQSATSNSWAITVQDEGEPANANDPLEGDYLVKTETYTSTTPLRRTTPWGTLTTEDDPNTPSVIVLSEGQLRYVQDASGNLTKGSEDPAIRTTYDADGNPNGTEEIPSDDETITDNTLFGSANKDKIDGKSGADLIDGKGGNDQIDGGSGDDMIGGGAGSDNIKGGDGNDYISSSANIQNTRQQVSATDTWNRWGLPDGETAITQGAMWGTYLSQQTPEFKVTVWSGITDTSTDASDTEGDVIDGGAGNRHLAWFRRRAAGRFDGFAHTTPGKTLNGMSKLD